MLVDGVLAVRASPREGRENRSPTPTDDEGAVEGGEVRSDVDLAPAEALPGRTGVLVPRVKFVRSLSTSNSVAAELVMSVGLNEGEAGSRDTASSVSSR